MIHIEYYKYFLTNFIHIIPIILPALFFILLSYRAKNKLDLFGFYTNIFAAGFSLVYPIFLVCMFIFSDWSSDGQAGMEIFIVPIISLLSGSAIWICGFIIRKIYFKNSVIYYKNNLITNICKFSVYILFVIFLFFASVEINNETKLKMLSLSDISIDFIKSEYFSAKNSNDTSRLIFIAANPNTPSEILTELKSYENIKIRKFIENNLRKNDK